MKFCAFLLVLGMWISILRDTYTACVPKCMGMTTVTIYVCDNDSSDVPIVKILCNCTMF